jgi:hypothetical protein
VYSALAIGEEPDADFSGYVPRRIVVSPATAVALARDTTVPLLPDAYAAQHPGVESPQAIQSVAVHTLTLYGVIDRGVTIANAMWLRRRPLRERGVFRWLEPPDFSYTVTVADIAIAAPEQRAAIVAAYVGMVHDTWMGRHGRVIADWYDRYIVSD